MADDVEKCIMDMIDAHLTLHDVPHVYYDPVPQFGSGYHIDAYRLRDTAYGHWERQPTMAIYMDGGDVRIDTTWKKYRLSAADPELLPALLAMHRENSNVQ